MDAALAEKTKLQNSENIEAFLSFIRDTQQAYRIADTVEQETHEQLQDILHKLELETEGDEALLNDAKLLKASRIQRREAKDFRDRASPIIEWADNNQQTIKSLEQLLGKTFCLAKSQAKTGPGTRGRGSKYARQKRIPEIGYTHSRRACMMGVIRDECHF